MTGRLITQMTPAHVVGLLLVLAVVVPFVFAALGETRRDGTKAAILAVTIVALTIALVASLD